MFGTVLDQPEPDYLDALEQEAILIIREAFHLFRRPCILFSGGKDSTVLLHLAKRAFAPGRIPLSVLHIDTGFNFPEVIEFRNQIVSDLGLDLHVGMVEDVIRAGLAREISGVVPSRNAAQSVALKLAISGFDLDALIGGGRRDEEKARAKERFFSPRTNAGGWDPELQRLEFGYHFNARIRHGVDNMRIFPLNNWTERDVWSYIVRHNVQLPFLYYSHRRLCRRLADGSLIAWSHHLRFSDALGVGEFAVRFRTVGDMTCTAATESMARTPEDVLVEITNSQLSERGTRIDDQISDCAMEDRKREGYF